MKRTPPLIMAVGGVARCIVPCKVNTRAASLHHQIDGHLRLKRIGIRNVSVAKAWGRLGGLPRKDGKNSGCGDISFCNRCNFNMSLKQMLAEYGDIFGAANHANQTTT